MRPTPPPRPPGTTVRTSGADFDTESGRAHYRLRLNARIRGPPAVQSGMADPAHAPDAAALSAADILKVARLSRLTLTTEEVPQYQARLSAVVAYMQRLHALDLSGVEPLTHIGDATNRFASDVPGPVLSNETLMRMAPESDGPFIAVPKVLGDGGGA